MRSLLVCQRGNFLHDLLPTAISDVITQPENIVWLDIRDPNDEDISLLRDEFGFHPLAIEDSIREHERPKVDAYGSYYFIVFYAVHYNMADDQLNLQALHLFIGANYLISVHSGDIRQIDETLRRWQAPNSPLGSRVAALLYALLDAVVDDYFPVMDRIADRVEDLEDSIFGKFDESSIEQIFGLKKHLLALRRVVSPQRDVLNVLLRRDLPVFQATDIVYLQDVYDHIVRVTDSVDTYRDLLSSALDSYLSLQSNRLNQIVKVLTITSIILMSNALIAGIYGMNFQYMPELNWRFGYPMAIGLMLVISVGLVFFFRRIKWW